MVIVARRNDCDEMMQQFLEVAALPDHIRGRPCVIAIRHSPRGE
jgi:hypothetical protein